MTISFFPLYYTVDIPDFFRKFASTFMTDLSTEIDGTRVIKHQKLQGLIMSYNRLKLNPQK